MAATNKAMSTFNLNLCTVNSAGVSVSLTSNLPCNFTSVKNTNIDTGNILDSVKFPVNFNATGTGESDCLTVRDIPSITPKSDHCNFLLSSATNYTAKIGNSTSCDSYINGSGLHVELPYSNEQCVSLEAS